VHTLNSRGYVKGFRRINKILVGYNKIQEDIINFLRKTKNVGWNLSIF
jgi:hypothetical protein